MLFYKTKKNKQIMTHSIHTPSDTLHVYDDILQTIRRTSLVRLRQIGSNLLCPIYANVEPSNPGDSANNRIAIDPGLMRLSIGLEKVYDSLNDLSQALRKRQLT
jgi:O-acetylhomoserine/O-acetylserine sulfhydrylase-like pyridoxal-dependent enzyme